MGAVVPGALNLLAEDLRLDDIVSIDTEGPRSAQTTIAQIMLFWGGWQGVNVLIFGAKNDGTDALGTTAGIQRALDFVAALGNGGSIYFPPGIYLVTAPLATRVAPNEGASFVLNSAYSNITMKGAGVGVSVIRPASNEIEIFAQDGATNLAFNGLTFDNTANGPLQNQPLPMVRGGPNTGVPGQGNGANCAIRQYEGANLTVTDCEFLEFIISIDYIGSFADDQVLVGDLIGEGLRFNGCVQGILAEQPKTILFTSSDYSDGIPSVNFGGSTDPGHAIYVSNRTGAYPHTITISDVSGSANEGESIRVRKGVSVAVSNCPVYASHRGHNFENCRALTVSNCPVTLIDMVPGDNNPAGIYLADCGNYTISNCVLDISATNAWGLRILTGGASASWNNKRGVIENVSIINDLSGDNVGKDWVVTDGQTDLTLRNISAFVTGNVAQSRPVVNVTSGTRIRVIRPARRSAEAGTPTGSDRLVQFQAGVVDCSAEWSRTDIDVSPTANVVVDVDGNATVLRVDGVNAGSWTPAPTFATPGDFVPVINFARGRYQRNGPVVSVQFELGFDCNAYTTAASTFQIGGLPLATIGSAVMAGWATNVGQWSFVTIGSVTDCELILAAGQSFFTMRSATSNASGTTLTVTSFPASKTGIIIRGQMTYLITE